MKKIIINKKFYGNIDLPKTRNAYKHFVSIVRAFSSNEEITIETMYQNHKLKSFNSYQRGGCADELLELEMYIKLSSLLSFSAESAVKLKNKIEFINDNAYVNLNISNNLILFNKKVPAKAKKAYVFWDIENFSNISPMFSHIIEPFEIEDENIYVSCNPDSLYLFKAEWEADLYDFGKTLNSFNFTKCDHGKNVADGILLKNFEDLKPVDADIYVVTYDIELKERFRESCSKSNNLYVLQRKILN
ncbi:hypothetical protein [Candidatus Sulfurimonas baltica]|uniref:Uncharacterized protein n=1 Tax=Candidatus Sulfurimonas baltica TaxID=2740404 RepID=A0A7S7RN52_9BACT|nr:hypothetical protein [Candidatus Sulfurimonas baltica]QOY52962.1 hypothetical protein HUE88_04560 [Candidatus Sulfurimonas baltica]